MPWKTERCDLCIAAATASTPQGITARPRAPQCYEYSLGRERRGQAMRTRFVVLLLLLPVLAQAHIYRWVDDNGKVHFSTAHPWQARGTCKNNPCPLRRILPPPLALRLAASSRGFSGHAIHLQTLQGTLFPGARVAEQARRAVQGDKRHRCGGPGATGETFRRPCGSGIDRWTRGA